MNMNPRDLHDLTEIIDRRIARAMARQPRVTYGTVDAVSGDTASVFLEGNDTSSGGFRIPATFGVAAGDFVRVVIHPEGDRWIGENLTAIRIPNTVTGAVDVNGALSADSLNIEAGGTFGSDVTIAGSVKPEVTGITASSNASAFPQGISFYNVGSASDGFPGSDGRGTLLTIRTSTTTTHVMQMFSERGAVTGGSRVHVRVWDNGDQSWMGWVLIA